MGRLRRRLTQDTADVDMTPMLDIVFIMLIFFIVTATFLNETGLDFTIPPETPCLHCPKTETIQIYIDAKNQVSVETVPVTLNAVPARVESHLADKPNANVLLMVSAKANLGPVIQIKDGMALAGRPTILKVLHN